MNISRSKFYLVVFFQIVFFFSSIFNEKKNTNKRITLTLILILWLTPSKFCLVQDIEDSLEFSDSLLQFFLE